MRSPALLAVLALALLPAATAAQKVAGTLVEMPDGVPVRGAMVVLLDSAGRPVSAAATGEDGTFTLAAARPGTYTLRVERRGFYATVSEPLTLAAGQEARVVLESGDTPAESYEASLAAAPPPPPGPPGRLTGLAWDSLAARPLAGATVRVEGREVTTDAAGRFSVEVPSGRHLVSLDHAALRAWGLTTRGTAVDVPAGGEARVQLGVPTEGGLMAHHCPPESLREHPGAMMGTLTLRGRPVPRARVRIGWIRMLRRDEAEEQFLEVDSDESGFYAACGVPREGPLKVSVRGAGGTYRGEHRMRGRLTRYDFTLTPPLLGR